MELSSENVIVIGLVAAVLVQGIKLAAAKLQKPIGRKAITVIIFVIAVVLAFIWFTPVVPAFPVVGEDPLVFAIAILAWLAQLIALASAVLGVATGIYNLLLEKVFDKLKIGKEKIVSLLTAISSSDVNDGPDI